MSWLRQFLRLRRQNGRVKLSLLFALLGLALAIDLGLGGGEYAAGLGPAEYVLERSQPGPATEAVLDQLRALEGVEAVSRQREVSLVSGERGLTVVVLSPQYLQDCYGLTPTGAAREYWLNPAAFSGFCAGETAPARVSFQEEGIQESGLFQLAPSLPGEEAFAVTGGSSAEMGDSPQVRLRLRGETAGAQALLEGAGFSVVNREELLEREHKAQLWMIRIRYEGLALVLTGLLAGALYCGGWEQAQRGT